MWGTYSAVAQTVINLAHKGQRKHNEKKNLKIGMQPHKQKVEGNHIKVYYLHPSMQTLNTTISSHFILEPNKKNMNSHIPQAK